MSSVGETLRTERLKRNLELDQISRELKIPDRFLAAIETERFEQLPAGVFAKSFVRQYANFLGLDGEALAVEVQRAMAPEALPAVQPGPGFTTQSEIRLPRMESWESVGDRRGNSSTLPALALVVVVMLVCSGVYAFWQRARHETPAAEQTATARAPAAAPTAAPAGSPAQAGASPQAPSAAQVSPAPQGSANPPVSAANGTASAGKPSALGEPAGQPANSADRPATEAHAPAAAAPAATANPATQAADAGAKAGPVHVELTATEPVWVLVRADGKYVFSGTMEPNETRTVNAAGALTLRVGNAGGIAITYNGKPVGAVGPKGQVREVQFTSGGFQILAAPKPPLPEPKPALPESKPVSPAPKPASPESKPVLPGPKPASPAPASGATPPPGVPR